MQALKHYPGHCEVFEMLQEFGATKHDQQTAWKRSSEYKMKMRNETEVQWFAEHFGILHEETGLHVLKPQRVNMYQYAKALGGLRRHRT
jgi:hypothetical protein